MEPVAQAPPPAGPVSALYRTFEKHRRERRQRENEREVAPLRGNWSRLHAAPVPHPAPAVNTCVAVQYFFPITPAWHSNTVVLARHRSAVAHDQNNIVV